jgi:hypothetical protein
MAASEEAVLRPAAELQEVKAPQEASERHREVGEQTDGMAPEASGPKAAVALSRAAWEETGPSIQSGSAR